MLWDAGGRQLSLSPQVLELRPSASLHSCKQGLKKTESPGMFTCLARRHLRRTLYASTSTGKQLVERFSLLPPACTSGGYGETSASISAQQETSRASSGSQGSRTAKDTPAARNQKVSQAPVHGSNNSESHAQAANAGGAANANSQGRDYSAALDKLRQKKKKLQATNDSPPIGSTGSPLSHSSLAATTPNTNVSMNDSSRDTSSEKAASSSSQQTPHAHISASMRTSPASNLTPAPQPLPSTTGRTAGATETTTAQQALTPPPGFTSHAANDSHKPIEERPVASSSRGKTRPAQNKQRQPDDSISIFKASTSPSCPGRAIPAASTSAPGDSGSKETPRSKRARQKDDNEPQAMQPINTAMDRTTHSTASGSNATMPGRKQAPAIPPTPPSTHITIMHGHVANSNSQQHSTQALSAVTSSAHKTNTSNSSSSSSGSNTNAVPERVLEPAAHATASGSAAGSTTSTQSHVQPPIPPTSLLLTYQQQRQQQLAEAISPNLHSQPPSHLEHSLQTHAQHSASYVSWKTAPWEIPQPQQPQLLPQPPQQLLPGQLPSPPPTLQPPLHQQQQQQPPLATLPRPIPPQPAMPFQPPVAHDASRQHAQQQQTAEDAARMAAAFGALMDTQSNKPPSYVRPKPRLMPLTQEARQFFANRCISEATLERNGIAMEHKFDPALQTMVHAVAFPYYREGEIINVKYRRLDKKMFWQVPRAEKVVYGYDDVKDCSEIIIVEGEMDKLALEEAGFTNVISVPDGAPATVQDKRDRIDPEQDKKFSYIWNCQELFDMDRVTKIILAVDNDSPGDALAEELARRLGKDRCWRVRWPQARMPAASSAEHAVEVLHNPAANPHQQLAASSIAYSAATPGANNSSNGAGLMQAADFTEQPAAQDAAAEAAVIGQSIATMQRVDAAVVAQGLVTAPISEAAAAPAVIEEDTGFRKDANEVLMKDGPEALHYLICNAEPSPITGLFEFKDFYSQIMDYYFKVDPDQVGVSSGWPALDEYYKIIPGELTIVTGVPNSGKSEWLDALLVNLAMTHGWCFAFCSLEKTPEHHARQLLEKVVRKPFFDHTVSNQPRMSWEDVKAGLAFITEHFMLIRLEEEQPTIDWILDKARAAVLRYGIRGLLIDPYNEIEHLRPAYMNETEYVSRMLSKVKKFAQQYECHVWFVAHPRQMPSWHGQPPELYDIAGSANFINKADNGIVVHRNWNRTGTGESVKKGAPNDVRILVRKVRNKAAGRIGEVTLAYDRVLGTYSDVTVDESKRILDVATDGANPGPSWGVGGQAHHYSTDASYIAYEANGDAAPDAYDPSYAAYQDDMPIPDDPSYAGYPVGTVPGMYGQPMYYTGPANDTSAAGGPSVNPYDTESYQHNVNGHMSPTYSAGPAPYPMQYSPQRPPALSNMQNGGPPPSAWWAQPGLPLGMAQQPWGLGGGAVGGFGGTVQQHSAGSIARPALGTVRDMSGVQLSAPSGSESDAGSGSDGEGVEGNVKRRSSSGRKRSSRGSKASRSTSSVPVLDAEEVLAEEQVMGVPALPVAHHMLHVGDIKTEKFHQLDGETFQTLSKNHQEVEDDRMKNWEQN